MQQVKNSTQPRKLYRFHGGIHLPDNKKQSIGLAVEKARLPQQLIIPLSQHMGEPAEVLVKVGDHVLKGEIIGKPQGYISAPVHAPTSGVVTAVEARPVPHPSGLPAQCIIIDSDGEDRWCELPEKISDYSAQEPALLRERIRNAGIVGLGGAAFPTSVKTNPGPDTPIHTLVINGAECEPYITCDDMLMRQQAEQVLTGAAILRHIIGADSCLIAIEDNKPEAIAAMGAAVTAAGMVWAEVVSIPTRYPSGGEKQLIKILTGEEIPSGGIPSQIGFVCHNVGTAAAVADAVLEGKPLISRYVTLTGSGISNPCNLEVLIGTPANELIEQAGGYTATVEKLILGGPMMGFTLESDAVPITKAANCLLATDSTESPSSGVALACIRCGRCAEACPVSLLPQQMYWYSRAKDLEKTQQYNLFDCIECGCCSHVCPSHIPLVQYFRFAKTESWAKERETKASDRARARSEARTARQERIKAERKALQAKKKAALAKKKAAEKEGGSDPKKAAIEAAKARAAKKKTQMAQEGVEPGNTENLTDTQQKAIDEVDSRRGEVAAEMRKDEEATDSSEQKGL
ncbi:MAG: electron transport complex subunit RsxC [Candidatus Sedimenticola sp. (ex Thyasira tokunagai)]